MDPNTASGMAPADLAEQIVIAIANGDADLVVAGTTTTLAIYIRSLFPDLFHWIMARRARKGAAAEAANAPVPTPAKDAGCAAAAAAAATAAGGADAEAEAVSPSTYIYLEPPPAVYFVVVVVVVVVALHQPLAIAG